MKFYMSYWSGGYYKSIDEYLVDIHRLSVHLIKKHYGECHLLTDSRSKPYFEDVGFTSIQTELDVLDGTVSTNWALGKLHAYKILCERGVPFCHVDYDVFLWKPLPTELLQEQVFCQSVERKVYDLYAFKMFEDNHVNRHMVKDTERRHYQSSYNVGIFGGNNLDFIKRYAEAGICFTMDTENQPCYELMNKYQPQSVACISEQYYLYVCSEEWGVPVKCLLNCEQEIYREKESCSVGYTHLICHKNHPQVKDAIYLKLYENSLKEIVK
jgi:hypothetical protein